MRILGIDPGYAIVGFGILEADRGQARLLGCGAINTPAGVPMPQRLLQIQEDLETLIRQFSPEVMDIFEYTPSQVKQAVVGYGKAEKRQVMDMTKRILHLSAVPKPDDAADAVAIAICHARSHTSRLTRFGL